MLGIVWVHVAFLNEHMLPSEIAKELTLDNKVLEFRRTGTDHR